MKLTVDFNPSNAGELKFVGGLGVALQVITDGMRSEEKKEAEPEEKKEAEPEEKKEAEPEEPTEETPAQEQDEPVEASVVEEKPKRSRRKKIEVQPEVVETPSQEEAPADNGELPFDHEVNEEPVAETKVEAPAQFPTMTKDEFTEINKAKRAELGLTVDGEHAALIRDFNTYCQKWASVTYGTTKPSTLPGEKLWQFAQWFQDIQLNPDYVPGSADEEHGCPFVSNALSK